jgi:hypothetical protein
MSNYESCNLELAPRLKKRGFENYEALASSICAMRFKDDSGVPTRKFSNPIDSNEKQRSFAMDFSIKLDDSYPEHFNSDLNVWEFPVLAITSGEHKYTEDGKEEKVYIEPSILKSNIEAFNELPVYVNHQRTPDDLIGKAINPSISEMDNGKIALKMLAQISDNDRAQEIVSKMKDGNVTNVSIDWFSKDIDVMGDTYATDIRPVEVSFIDNEVAEAVCKECTIDTKCATETDESHDCGCDGSSEACGCSPADGKDSEDDIMSDKQEVKSEAESLIEREFANYKKQLEELTTSHSELQKQYESATTAISEFETAEAKRVEEEANARKREIVNSIVSKELLVRAEEEYNKDVRFEELFKWDENKLAGYSEAMATLPAAEDTERSFGKGKSREASEAPVETQAPERERLFSMDKNGKIVFNKKSLEGE